MRKFVGLFGVFLVLLAAYEPVSAMNNGSRTKQMSSKNSVRYASTAKRRPVVVLDDFEDGLISRNPEWWRFGGLLISVQDNGPIKKGFKYLGAKSLQLRGSTEKWYVGGAGIYIARDVSGYSSLKFVVYSPGYNSGILRIELYDDDNHNWIVDTDSGQVTADDVFVSNVLIDWEGWRVISLPIPSFEDDNPGVGDDTWNPYQAHGSGGLLQMQLIATTAKDKKAEVNFSIDTIKLVP